MGKKIVANIVMLGFATAQTKISSYDAMKSSIKESVPARFIELNMKAFQIGYDYIGD
jgi:2-oxoglutarate ferredoxin oxidoreductase subunit gamma